MALEGNLNDFGLSEILQLIAVQKKTGLLSVTSQGESMVLFFREGNLISTRDRRRKGDDPLKNYLLRYGVLSRKDFLRITQLASQSNLDITDIIVSEGYLSEEEMKRHYRNQIQEALHQVLTWQQCSYKFIPNPEVVRGIKTWGEFGVEGLLMESMRRIDEFPQMLEEFPDPDMVIKKTGEGEGLEANEQAVFDLIGEGATVGYLVARAKMPAFDTYEALKHLKEKGLIATESPVHDMPSPRRAEISPSRRFRLGSLVPTTMAFLVFASCLFLGATGFALRFGPRAADLNRDLFARSLARKQAEAKIRYHLELYRASHGRYPRTLDQLWSSELLDKQSARRLQAFSFRYHLTPSGTGYTLF